MQNASSINKAALHQAVQPLPQTIYLEESP
nr:MAG TPA: hypothetical protein [Bacteriophage sp.]